MNKTMNKAQSNLFNRHYELIRHTMKEMMNDLNDGERELFRKMYDHKNLYKHPVDAIPVEKLDCACKQIENTLEKKNEANLRTA